MIIKKIYKIPKAMLVPVLLAILILCTVVPAFGEAEAKNGIDALLIIDNSSSMQDADAQRNAIEATKMFIDMLEPGNSRVGILGFSDNVSIASEITEITSQEDKEALKAQVDKMRYQGYSDIGASVKDAVSIMNGSMRPGVSPMILLLTDGNVDVNPRNQERNTEDSYNDIVEALVAAEKKIPIYTLGLNYDGSVDRQLLRTIADNTGGRSYIISQAAELPRAFNEIFAAYVKSVLLDVDAFTANGNYMDVTIDITEGFVAEANIIILSEKKLADVAILDPSGNQLELNQGGVSYASSQRYAILKLESPQQGDWTLQVKAAKNDPIKVSLICRYNVDVEIAVSQEDASGGLYKTTSPITITGQFVVNGSRTGNDELYRSTTSNVIINDEKGSFVAKVPMMARSNGVTAQYQPDNDKPLNIYIEMTASRFMKESDTIAIEFAPPVPEQTPTPEPEPTPPPEPEEEPVTDWETVLKYSGIVAAALAVPGAIAFVIAKLRKPKAFRGYVEVCAMTEYGSYTSVAFPPLHEYSGEVDLDELLMDNTPAKMQKQLSMLPFSVEGITLRPAKSGRQPAVFVENDSDCVLMDEDCVALGTKKFTWRADEKIIVGNSEVGSLSHIELTYRLEEV